MGRLVGNATRMEDTAARLEGRARQIEQVMAALESCEKGLAANQALERLGYNDRVAVERISLRGHIREFRRCSKALYEAALLYHDFENYALGALDGKSPKEVMFADDGSDEAPAEKKTFANTVRVTAGGVTITAKSDGLLQAIAARPIARIVYLAKDVPWDPDEYVSVGESVDAYLGSITSGGAGIGREQADGNRTAGAYGGVSGSLYSNEVSLQFGDDQNNKRVTVGLDVLAVSAEGGAEVSKKDDSYAGWNLGVSLAKGRMGGGFTDDGAKLDVLAEVSAGSVSSENKGRMNVDTGDVEYGIGLAAMAGAGFRVKGENITRKKR